MGETCCGGKAAQTASVTATSAPETNIVSALRLYRPLIVITAVSILAAAALALSGRMFMDSVMGLFLIFLATLQLFDLNSFARMFAKYDIIGGKYFTYALAYPFIELALGLFYLWGGLPLFTNGVTIIVMLVGMIGIANTIHKGEQVQCACIGAGFTLPVGRVTLAENGIMALMAVLSLNMGA
jgi:hypothetical protein